MIVPTSLAFLTAIGTATASPVASNALAHAAFTQQRVVDSAADGVAETKWILPPLKEQNAIQGGWVKERTGVIIPRLLDEFGVECWIVSQREYGEDPVFWGLVQRTTTFSARRRSTILFCGDQHWSFIDNTPKLWEDLSNALEEANPDKIALDIDPTSAFADGLHAGELEALLVNLPVKFSTRLTTLPLLPVKFIATRTESMLKHYKEIMKNAHLIIAEGFSSNVIIPGKTTTEDVQWWFRERIQSDNMTTWFHPSVDLSRYVDGKVVQMYGPDAVIEKGDVLWCDFGVTALGLNTDTQHMAYVLKDDEDEPPVGLRRGLTHHSNVMQDLVMDTIQVGMSGNEVLSSVRVQMDSKRINGTVYCHPIGDWGHAAGSLIGMTNLQDGVPGLGDFPIFPSMWYSIELQANVPIPEWNNVIVNFRQEEEAYIDADGQTHWVRHRQERLHVVGAKMEDAEYL